MRPSQGAAAPNECTEQKQPQGARKLDVQGNEQRDFANPERQYLAEAARCINLICLQNVTLD